MTLENYLILLGLFSAGVSLYKFNQIAGTVFCHLGKLSWWVSTFGLLDMSRFYDEKRSGEVMKVGGIVLCFAGLFYGVFEYVTLDGPNGFAAMRQAESYVNKADGNENEYSEETCFSLTDKQVTVTLIYGDKKRVLNGIWDGKQYIFTDQKQD
jgi:hypothetical protein